MEGSSVLSFSTPKSHLRFNTYNSSSPSFQQPQSLKFHPKHLKLPKNNSLPQNSLISAVSTVPNESLEKPSVPMSSPKEMMPKVDKSGRFCSPRAARELALSIVYASCLEGSDPIRLFDKRVNVKRGAGYEFNKSLLTEYNHMSFGGPPISTKTEEEAEDLLREIEKQSSIGNTILF
ncbi:hypothetical protein GIB67_010045 [Kingdonia uniflora]|uniref:Uncharacterized protein n=1 Tax=Kingdonia uniflora TaxID=39325 RepID=A0A7J7KV66_9MAGN|nr:hypothetical protein GIB67_010045 [Kingdonia uniflora]